MADLYRIKDWNERFETAQSRRCKVLNWVAIPNSHDGAGYRRLMARDDATAIYGIWVLIVQVASKCSPRGTLANGSNPLTAIDLHFKTGAPEKDFETAFEVLSSPEIGWLEVVDSVPGCLDSEPAPSTIDQTPDTQPNQTDPTQQDKQNITQPNSTNGVGFKEFFKDFDIDSGLVGRISAKMVRLTGCKKSSDLMFIDKVAIITQMGEVTEACVLEAAKAVQDRKPRPDVPIKFFRKCLQNRIPDFEDKLAKIP